jgi:hypothetical protein
MALSGRKALKGRRAGENQRGHAPARPVLLCHAVCPPSAIHPDGVGCLLEADVAHNPGKARRRTNVMRKDQ